MEFFLYALIVLAIAFILFGLWMLTGGGSTESGEKVQKRLRRLTNPEEIDFGEEIAEAEDQRKAKTRKQRSIVKKDAFGDIPALNQRLKHSSWAQVLSGNLQQAKIPLSVGTFLLVCLGCGIIGSGVVYMILGKVDVLWCSVACLPFMYMPILYVRIVVAQRMKRFTAQFPDALDLLGSSVRAGLAFNAAIQNVADEMPEPICDDFRILSDEFAFNVPLAEALQHLQDRAPTVDVKFFCTAVMIQRDTGGNLAEILDGLQKTIRERFRIIGQIKTLTAQGRMSGWVLGILPIALGAIIYVVNPDHVKLLFEERLGHLLLLVAGTMQLVGFLMIRKIVKVKI